MISTLKNVIINMKLLVFLYRPIYFAPSLWIFPPTRKAIITGSFPSYDIFLHLWPLFISHFFGMFLFLIHGDYSVLILFVLFLSSYRAIIYFSFHSYDFFSLMAIIYFSFPSSDFFLRQWRLFISHSLSM